MKKTWIYARLAKFGLCIGGLFLLGVPISGQSSGLYFPPTTGEAWETMMPSELGYCDASIDNLYEYLADNQSKAFILLKDGKIVLEQYFGTFAQDSLWYWASAGKTLTSFLVGKAQEEGFLSIEDPTVDYLGEGWTSAATAQEAKITIWNQLTMTTGLNDRVDNQDCTKPECLEYLAEPGTRWAYHNGPYTLLDSVLQRATDMSLNQYLFTRVRTPIGMNGAYIKTGDNTVYFSNARSFARFGLLLLADGQWAGQSILGDQAYLTQMTTSSQTINPSYGYLTWLNGQDSFMVPQLQITFQGPMSPSSPVDSYAALGKNGQILNVVPSEGLVWIRMGNPPDQDNGLVSASLNEGIWQRIKALNCNATSTEIFKKEMAVDLFPNPASIDLKINAPVLIESLQVVHLNGEVIHQEKVEALAAHIDLSGYANGLYMIGLVFEDGRHWRKLVVKQ